MESSEFEQEDDDEREDTDDSNDVAVDEEAVDYDIIREIISESQGGLVQVKQNGVPIKTRTFIKSYTDPIPVTIRCSASSSDTIGKFSVYVSLIVEGHRLSPQGAFIEDVEDIETIFDTLNRLLVEGRAQGLLELFNEIRSSAFKGFKNEMDFFVKVQEWIYIGNCGKDGFDGRS